MKPNELKNQECPICHEKKLILREAEIDVPHFGLAYVFSMTCEKCRFHKADVEFVEKKEPCRFSIEIDSDEDMSIKIVKSSQATVKIPHIVTIESGPASNGYITNVEGIFDRVKQKIQGAKEDDDEAVRKKAKNLLKKIQRIIWGREKSKIVIEDPSGNSAIISDKAVCEKLKC